MATNQNGDGSQSPLKHGDEVAMVMIPYPGHSHLNQLLHLSNLIATSFDIPIHFIQYCTTANHHPDNPQLIISSKVHFHEFHLPPNPNTPSSSFPLFLLHITSHLRQPLLQLSQQLSPQFKRIIVVHDSLMPSVPHDVIKSIPNGEAYTFHPLSAFTNFFSWWQSLSRKPFDLDGPSLDVPTNEGCFPPDLSSDFFAMQHRINSEITSGRIFNTSRLIEGRFIDLLEKQSSLSSNTRKTKLFPLGPLNPVEVGYEEERVKHRCLEWLDQQEPNSVLYISFGTMTLMSDEQVKELAIGLERSKQKFIWVLKNVYRDYLEGNQSTISAHDQALLHLLPLGFEERVRAQGLVVTDWAPQLQILAHRSTGGFMSHSGWGSCMESISMGVPMLVWPMRSDHPKNSVLITQVLKVGVIGRDWATRGEMVSAEMVENVVRKLMASEEGNEVRIRAKELGLKVRESVLAQGGQSRLEMESFIAHITR